MFLDNISKDTEILCSDFNSIFLKGSDIAVLIIHGFTGSPHNMQYIGKRLNKAGYTVYIPRLPGHGTNSTDFLNSTWRDWLRRVVDSYIELKTTYKKVYVLGLSMGGVLTLLLASQFTPEKIVLAAPAIEATDWRLKLTPIIKLFTKKIKRKKREVYNDDCLKKLTKEYWTYNFPSKGADLYKLQKLAKKRMNKVKSDTLIIVSKKDNTVPLKVKDIIKNNINSDIVKTIILEESGHVVVDDVEKEVVANEVIKFFI
ncbi:esterase [Marinitoga sp. 1154]|uniref:alpha/beta hydrolase n=1 Tax=Marinitoga sp. 1154 TaxID=1643335 RepID=UPI001586B0AC|nr:alpha/beta fold hydrolase [Marinitoga sp. 1154]NUU99454.1 esterase [Marinitoga sp. 1154]